MIEIVGTALNQWDTGRVVLITGVEAEYAHFANKGDSKAVIMGVVDIEAKIPDYLLQTGKPLCVYAVKDGVTVESRTFSVRNRERPENYVYEDDQRNYIYELITDAEQAIEAAREAANNANPSATEANAAAEKANKAAASASEAAKNANDAATKAAHTAKNLMVIGEAEGANISLDDAAEQYLVGLRIFGKSTQDGTPKPDAPVDLVSVGDSGSITVNVNGDNDAQNMTIATPNGLPGIPVTSGGNYTDANGKQWFCDEIDFDKGVYLQRCMKLTANQLVPFHYYELENCARVGCNLTLKSVNYANGLSTHLPLISNYTMDTPHFYSADGALWIFAPISELTERSKEGAIAWANRLGIEFVYALEIPIETPLSSEELAAYASLHTTRGNTTVSNDAGAWMELEYVMDAKKYIDRLAASGGASAPARLASVSLLASKWTGSNNLYSQVVSIDGITENSQVNLTPSVEQLAVFYQKDITFVTENDNGVLTVYVIGQKPQNDYTIQASIVEVVE